MREPLYNSPLIGQYPFAVMDAERYVQALKEKDTESLALHLGLYDDNEQTKSVVEQMLQKYAESLELITVKIISKGYDWQENQFSFELRDGNQRTHELRIAGDTYWVVDKWAAD